MTIHRDMFDNSKESKMRGNLQPYTTRNLTIPANLDLMNKVAQIWDDCVGTDPMRRDNIVLESVGGWLCQEAWHDRTGFHLKIRMHPLYSHAAVTQERAKAVLDAFIGLFSKGTVVFAENTEILDAGDINWREKESSGQNQTITVVVETGSYSIGD